MTDLPTQILTWVESNPALVVALVVDVIMGFTVAKRVLHPYLGRFDIAYLLEPLGERDAKVKQAGETVEVQGQIMMVAGRQEFNPDRKMITFGRGKDTESYRLEKPGDAEVKKGSKKKAVKPKPGEPAPPEGAEADPATLPGPGFLQWTHRVWFFRRGQAYPIHVSFGGPARTTSAAAADKFVRLSFWEQAVRGARAAADLKIPVSTIAVYIVVGAAISAAFFFAVHPGFVPVSSAPAQSVSTTELHSTSSTISTIIFNGNSTTPSPGAAH